MPTTVQTIVQTTHCNDLAHDMLKGNLLKSPTVSEHM